MRDYLVLTAVAVPLAGAVLAIAFSTRPSMRRFTAPGAVLAAGLVLLCAVGLQEGVLVRLPFPRLEPVGLFGAVPGYLADRLARSFLLLLGLTGLGGLMASFGASARQAAEVARRRGTALLLLAGCASLVLSANLLTVYLSWCLIDLAILLTMVLPDAGHDSPAGPALRTLVINQLASLAVLLAAIQATPEDGVSLLGPGYGPSVTWLLLLAGLVRAGLYPLHLGLPLATGGPAWGASLLRLLPTASGLYLVIRVLAGPVVVPEVLAVVGGLSLVATGLLAWLAPDEERTLAYVTANQVSLVLLSLAPNNAQTDVAALAVAVNLVLSINLLFLTGNLAQPPTVGRAGRWVWRLRVVAVAALAGVPPALGFVGRWGLYRYAVEQGLWLLLVVAALGSAFTFAGLLPLLRPVEAATPSGPRRALTGALVVLAVPFIVLGLQPLLLSPVLEALGGPGTYQMLLRLVRTTGQSVGVAGMAAILLPLVAGYGLDQVLGEAADLEVTRGRVLHVLGLEWLQQVLWAGSGWLGRLIHRSVEPLEGERYLAWVLLLGLLAILLLARHIQ